MIILKLDYNHSYIIPADMLTMLPHMVKTEQIGDKWIKHKLDLEVRITDQELVTGEDSELLQIKDELKSMENMKKYYENKVKELEKNREQG